MTRSRIRDTHSEATVGSGRRAARCTAAVLLRSGLLAACSSSDNRTGVSLILKTQTNPYFVSMRKAALEQATKSDVHLSVAAGTADGDTQNQINEIYTAIARGDKGILITSNGDAVNAALRQGEKRGPSAAAAD